MDDLDWMSNGWTGKAQIELVKGRKMIFALDRPPGLTQKYFSKIKISIGESILIPYTEYLNFFDKECGYILPDTMQDHFKLREEVTYYAFYSD